MNDVAGEKLRHIRHTSEDIRGQIEKILEKDDKIEIATTKSGEYADDLYMLMRRMADTANPILRELGLGKEAVEEDIKEFVEILKDNEQKLYFATVNLDAKYTKNKYMLLNLKNWHLRLEKSVENILGYLETETEERELKRLFERLDKTSISEREKRELKEEFLLALNRLNKNEIDEE